MNKLFDNKKKEQKLWYCKREKENEARDGDDGDEKKSIKMFLSAALCKTRKSRE